jgi:hypothetical protein
MAHAKAIVSGNTGFKLLNRMSAEQKAVYDAMQRVEHAKKGSIKVRKNRNIWQGQRDRGVLSRISYKLI